MSGTKTVTIGASEHQRLQAAQTRLRSVQQDLPEVIAASRRESLRELNQRLAPIEQRQQRFQGAVDRMSEQVRDAERRTAHRLQQQQHEFRAALGELDRDIRADVRSDMEDQEYRLTNLLDVERQEREDMDARLSNRIDREAAARRRHVRAVQRRMQVLIQQERQEREAQVNEVRQELRGIQAREAAKRDLARAWITDATTMAEFIEGNYRHARFAPERLEALTLRVRDARGSVNGSPAAPEAALATAQAAFRELSQLRLDLEMKEEEWHLWRAAASQEARELETLVASNMRCRVSQDGASPTSKKEADAPEIDMDYWTRGALTALGAEMRALTDQLAQEPLDLTTEDLRRTAEVTLPQMRKRLEKVMTEGQDAFCRAETRRDIANRMIPVLNENAYDLETFTGVGGDERDGLAFKAADDWDNAVVITISPRTDSPAEEEVQIHSYDHDEEVGTEDERIRRACGLAEALRDGGMDVGGVRTVADRPDPTLQDLDNTSKPVAQQPVERPEPVLQPAISRHE